MIGIAEPAASSFPQRLQTRLMTSTPSLPVDFSSLQQCCARSGDPTGVNTTHPPLDPVVFSENATIRSDDRDEALTDDGMPETCQEWVLGHGIALPISRSIIALLRLGCQASHWQFVNV